MRIVSGKYKGRRITAPKNLPVRPTTDIGKESLFNILNSRFDFEGLNVLDLFSGTGNISYEFGSRGCDSITSVDADAGCVKFIRQTAKEFDFPISVISANVFTFLQKQSNAYDLIFADPPYAMEQKDFEKLVNLIFDRNLLDAEGMLVIEHSRYTKMEHLPNFSFQRNYGGAYFSFFEFASEESED